MLDALGVERSPVIQASIGWLLAFNDPARLELRCYTAPTSADGPATAGHSNPPPEHVGAI